MTTTAIFSFPSYILGPDSKQKCEETFGSPTESSPLAVPRSLCSRSVVVFLLHPAHVGEKTTKQYSSSTLGEFVCRKRKLKFAPLLDKSSNQVTHITYYGIFFLLFTKK